MSLQLDIHKQLGNFSLQVQASINGEHTGIFGASGSGKSTLVSLIAGLTHPDKGEIVLDGTVLYSSKKSINLPPEKRRIAIVFQHAMLFPHLSVKTNLLYGFKRCHKEHRRIKPEALIALLKLQPLLERGVQYLSGGEKQRIALGRAVLANPCLLLMDEPLSALDNNLRFQIIPYLKSVSEEFKIPYLFISHSTTEMRLMSDTILTIEHGRCTTTITPEQLARSTMADSTEGYLNLLNLTNPCYEAGLAIYQWGENQLLISSKAEQTSSLFELPSRDIILFKKHPEAISARNLLECTVTELFDSGGRVGVVLATKGETIVAEIVRQAANELQITVGSTLFAAIKASSFRQLG